MLTNLNNLAKGNIPPKMTGTSDKGQTTFNITKISKYVHDTIEEVKSVDLTKYGNMAPIDLANMLVDTYLPDTTNKVIDHTLLKVQACLYHVLKTRGFNVTINPVLVGDDSPMFKGLKDKETADKMRLANSAIVYVQDGQSDFNTSKLNIYKRFAPIKL